MEEPCVAIRVAECAYVLAYAVIMLNTDAHNDMVRYKMTLKEFLVNVAHNDGGELIPQQFLEDMYASPPDVCVLEKRSRCVKGCQGATVALMTTHTTHTRRGGGVTILAIRGS